MDLKIVNLFHSCHLKMLKFKTIGMDLFYNLIHTKANSQRNTDFGVHVLFVYLSNYFSWITLLDNN